MSKRRLALALLALAALAAGLWLATRGGGAAPARDGAALRPMTAPSAAAAPSGRADLAGLPERAEPAAGASAPAARAVAGTAYEDELARGVWIEGRVAIPADTPLDERVRVVAEGMPFEHGPAHAVAVDAGGRFRVAFAEGTRAGKLDLAARYLFLDEPAKVSAQETQAVVLAARLGGVLRGRVLPPAEAEEGAEALAGKRVKLRGWKRTGERQNDPALERSAELDPLLAYTFTALPPDLRYEVECDPDLFEPAQVEELYVQAGEETVIDLALGLGVRLKGRVVDETGAAAPGVQVHAMVEADGRWTMGRWRQSMTAGDGTFSLEGVSPGLVTLHIESKGHETLEHPLGRLERGAVQSDLEVKLAVGSSVAGSVLWPDGSPAEGALVSAELVTSDGFSQGRGPNTRTDAQGVFTLSGLKPGLHRVQAQATQKKTALVTSELTGKTREKTVRTPLHATLTDVAAGTAGLVLKLAEGLELGGAVVDDLGAPVERFRVTYGRLVQENGYTFTRREKGRDFKDGHGAFALADLEPGTYRLTFEAEGHVSPPPLDTEVPALAGLPPIRMPRAARVAGLVLTPRGEPAARAVIETDAPPKAANTGWQQFVAISPGGGERFSVAGEADAEGRFALDDAGTGALRVRAVLAGYAPSEALALELAPGEAMESAVLRLKPGATLTGVVLGADGRGDARRLVEVSNKLGSGVASAQSDEAGAFAFQGLEPGTWSVSAPPTEAELAALGASAADGAHDVLALKAEVELGPEGAHVVLAPSGLRPVRVFGTVTAGGRPCAAHLWINIEGGHTGISAEADEGGAYEVLLPAPGSYLFSLSLEGNAGSLGMGAAVKGPAEERLDFDVPVGSIEGRVYGPDGPLAGLAVDLRLERQDGSEGWGFARATTEEDGRYAVERLPAGTWTVVAGGDSGTHGGGPLVASTSYARAEQSGVVVAGGQRVRDVDLHLSVGGGLAGRVLTAAGEPAPGARVMVRSPAGVFIEPYSSATADEAGSFTLSGLAPGDYLLAVMLGADQGVEAPATVEAGEETRVELRLAAATLVRVLVKDKQGLPVQQAYLTCQSTAGRDYSSWLDWSSHQDAPPGEQRLGPLPPGTYTFKADRQGATPDPKTVTLKGEKELVVELVL